MPYNLTVLSGIIILVVAGVILYSFHVAREVWEIEKDVRRMRDRFTDSWFTYEEAFDDPSRRAELLLYRLTKRGVLDWRIRPEIVKTRSNKGLIDVIHEFNQSINTPESAERFLNEYAEDLKPSPATIREEVEYCLHSRWDFWEWLPEIEFRFT